MVGQPMVGGSTAPLPVPILVPVWDMRNGGPQRGAWLGPGRGQEVFGQGPKYLGKPPPGRGLGCHHPPVRVPERDGVGTGV